MNDPKKIARKFHKFQIKRELEMIKDSLNCMKKEPHPSLVDASLITLESVVYHFEELFKEEA